PRPRMQRLRRLIAWSFFLGFLAAVGTIVFHFVRYRPRCTIESIKENFNVQRLSKDGCWLAALSWPLSKDPAGVMGRNEYMDEARFQVFDTRTGKMARSFENVEQVTPLSSLRQSPATFFAVRRAGVTLLTNWQTGETWEIDSPGDPDSYLHHF